jgi:2-succinyl-6-hydroxy-2,4-cyclohexadiene-1-carboxylate synthase
VRGCVDRHRVIVDRVSYAVRVHGTATGPGAVVLLHGFSGSGDDWRDTAETLAGSGFRAIAVDLPGHGATDTPSDPCCYRPTAVVHGVATVLTSLGIGAAHWVGYSMGARLALRAALDAPSRVLSLTLESASTGIPDPLAREERRQRDELLATDIEKRGIAWFVQHWESLPIFATQASLSPSRREAQRTRRLLQRPEGLARALRGLGQGAAPDLTHRLATILHPTLLVAGAVDSAYVASAQRIVSLLPSASVRIVPEAGHNVHLERPEEFKRALLDHLASVRRGNPAGALSSHRSLS